MIELVASLYIFLQVGAGGNVSQDVALTFEHWLAIFTSIGVPLGGAIVWITNFYKTQIEAQEKQYKAQVENLKEAYNIDKRRLSAILEKRESEIKELDEKTKRLENIYSTELLEPEGAKTFLDLLIINLNHLRNGIKDDDSLSKIDKIEAFCKDSLNSLDIRASSEREAANWLSNNKLALVKECVKHTLNKFNGVLYKDSGNKDTIDYDHLYENINRLISCLENSLRRGKLLTKIIPIIKKHEIIYIIEALQFIRKTRAPEELPSGASMAIQNFIGEIIQNITTDNRSNTN
jgi:hypothetical protein